MISKIFKNSIIIGGGISITAGTIGVAAYVVKVNAEESKNEDLVIDVNFDNNHFTKLSELDDFIAQYANSEKVKLKETEQFTLTIGGQQHYFSSVGNAIQYLKNNFVQQDKVYFDKDWQDYIDPVTGEFYNQSGKVQYVKNEKLYNIYRKSDGSFLHAPINDENANQNALTNAAKSYIQVHNAFFYDGVYYKSKSDFETHYRKKFAENKLNIGVHSNLKKLTTSTGETRFFNTNDVKGVEEFLYSYAMPYYKPHYYTSDSDMIPMTEENIGAMIGAITEEELDYIKIENNNDRLVEYVDMDKETPNGKLMGPSFVESGEGIFAMKDKNNWVKGEFKEANKTNNVYVQVISKTIDTLIQEFLLEKNGENEHQTPLWILFNNGLFDVSEKFYFKTKGLSLFDYISTFDQTLLSKFQSMLINASKGANFNIFTGIVMSYKWMINYMIQEKYNIDRVKDVANIFNQMSKLLDKLLAAKLKPFIGEMGDNNSLNYFEEAFSFNSLTFQRDTYSYIRRLASQYATPLNQSLYTLIMILNGFEQYILYYDQIISSLYGDMGQKMLNKEAVQFTLQPKIHHEKLLISSENWNHHNMSKNLIWKNFDNNFVSEINGVTREEINRKIDSFITEVNSTTEIAVANANSVISQLNMIYQQRSNSLYQTLLWDKIEEKYYYIAKVKTNEEHETEVEEVRYLDGSVYRYLTTTVGRSVLTENGVITDNYNLSNNSIDSPIKKLLSQVVDVVDKIVSIVKSAVDIIDGEIIKKFTKLSNTLSALSMIGPVFAIASILFEFLKVTETKNSYYFNHTNGDEFVWDGGVTKSRFFGIKTDEVFGINNLKLIDPIVVNDGYFSKYYLGDGIYRDDLTEARGLKAKTLISEVAMNKDEYRNSAKANIYWRVELNNSKTSFFDTITKLSNDFLINNRMAEASTNIYQLDDGQISSSAEAIFEQKLAILLSELRPIYIFKEPEIVNGRQMLGSFNYVYPLYHEGEIIERPTNPNSMEYKNYEKYYSKLTIINKNINLANVKNDNPDKSKYLELTKKPVEDIFKENINKLITKVSVETKLATFGEMLKIDINEKKSFDLITSKPKVDYIHTYINNKGYKKYFDNIEHLLEMAAGWDEFRLFKHLDIIWDDKYNFFGELYNSKKEIRDYLIKNFTGVKEENYNEETNEII